MTLNTEWVIVTFCLFTRCSAMLMAAPLTVNSVPVQVRVLTSATIALALSPVIQPHFGALPDSLYELVFILFREVLTGVLIGACLHLVASIAEMAGNFGDMQIGLASAQLFSPQMGSAATPLSRFKFMLAVVLIFASDAHHLMFRALVGSYKAPDLSLAGMEGMLPEILSMLSQAMLLSLQIVAPLAAVGIIVDLAAGFINKAVPQTQPFLLAMPAKLAMGLVVMAIGLPALVAGVRMGVENSFGHLGRIFGG